jgi:hypothetical protein
VVEFSATSQPPSAADGSAAADAAADGPLPTQLPMKCDGATSQVTLVLPCAVGMNPLNATECYLSGAVDTRSPALDFLVPLKELAHLIDQPLDLAQYFVVAPAWMAVDGKSFRMSTIRGTAVFSRVDPVERSFAGRLESMSVVWATDEGATIDCFAADSPFWAVPGNFL